MSRGRCFSGILLLYDPKDVGNLISGSSAFSKPSLCMWNFLVHVVLNPSLKDFEQYLALMRNEQLYCSLDILWDCPSLGLQCKLTFFHSCGHCWVFQICWHTECSTLTASSFRILKSSGHLPVSYLFSFSYYSWGSHGKNTGVVCRSLLRWTMFW